jgi:hypothetical protein
MRELLDVGGAAGRQVPTKPMTTSISPVASAAAANAASAGGFMGGPR